MKSKSVIYSIILLFSVICSQFLYANVVGTNYYSYVYDQISEHESFPYSMGEEIAKRDELNTSHREEQSLHNFHNYSTQLDYYKQNFTYPDLLSYVPDNINQTLFDNDTTEYVDFQNDNESYGSYTNSESVHFYQYRNDSTLNGTAIRIYEAAAGCWTKWGNGSSIYTNFSISFSYTYWEQPDYTDRRFIFSFGRKNLYPDYATAAIELLSDTSFSLSMHGEPETFDYEFISNHTYHFFISVEDNVGTKFYINNQLIHIYEFDDFTDNGNGFRDFGIGYLGEAYSFGIANGVYDDFKLKFEQSNWNHFEEDKDIYFYNNFSSTYDNYNINAEIYNQSHWELTEEGYLHAKTDYTDDEAYIYYPIDYESDYLPQELSIECRFKYNGTHEHVYTNDIFGITGNDTLDYALNIDINLEHEDITTALNQYYAGNLTYMFNEPCFVRNDTWYVLRIDITQQYLYLSLDGKHIGTIDKTGWELEFNGIYLGDYDSYTYGTYWDYLLIMDYQYKNYTQFHKQVYVQSEVENLIVDSEPFETSYIGMDLDNYHFNIQPYENTPSEWDGSEFAFNIMYEHNLSIYFQSWEDSGLNEIGFDIDDSYENIPLHILLNSTDFTSYDIIITRLNDSVELLSDSFESDLDWITTDFNVSLSSEYLKLYGFESSLNFPYRFELVDDVDYDTHENMYYNQNNLRDFKKINDVDSDTAYESYRQRYWLNESSDDFPNKEVMPSNNTPLAYGVDYFMVNNSLQQLACYDFSGNNERMYFNFTEYYGTEDFFDLTLYCKIYPNQQFIQFYVEGQNNVFSITESGHLSVYTHETQYYIPPNFQTYTNTSRPYFVTVKFTNDSIVYECQELGIHVVEDDGWKAGSVGYLRIGGKVAFMFEDCNSTQDLNDFVHGYYDIDVDYFLEYSTPGLTEDNQMLFYRDLNYLSINFSLYNTSIMPQYYGSVKTEIINNEYISYISNETFSHVERIYEVDISNNTQYMYDSFNSTINCSARVYVDNYQDEYLNFTISIEYLWKLIVVEIEPSLFEFILTLLTPFIMFFIFPFVFKRLSSREGDVVPISLGTILSFIIMGITGQLSLINSTIMVMLAIGVFIFLKKREDIQGGTIERKFERNNNNGG